VLRQVEWVRRWSALLLFVGVLASVVTVGAGSASAHPFGDPESAEISLTDDDTVRVHWQVGMVDDFTYLAQALGVLDPDRELLDGVLTPELGDWYRVQRAPSLPAYVLSHLSVQARGRACPGTVLPVEKLAADGITVDFTCAAPVSSADVSISMLADLSDLYRTVATGPDGTRQVYTGTATTHRWALSRPSAGHHPLGLAPGRWLVLAAVVLGLLGVVAFAATRRRQRARPSVVPARGPPAPVS
jgi:hypothetical protein